MIHADHVRLFLEKRAGSSGQLGELSVHPSDACQLNCTFCELPPKPQMMEPDTCRAVFELAPLNVVLVGGGEPTTAKPSTWNVISEGARRIHVKLVTNGVRLPPGFGNEGGNLSSVRISLNAGSSESFRDLTGKDRFDDVLKNVDTYLDSVIPEVGLGYVVTRQSISGLPQVVDEAFRRFWRAHPDKFYVQLKPLYPFGHESQAPEFEQELAAIGAIRRDSATDPWRRYFVSTAVNLDVLHHNRDRPETLPPPPQRCHVSLLTNVVRADGYVYPCNLFARRRVAPLGEVTKDTRDGLIDAQSSFYLRHSPRDFPLCQQCPQKHLNALLDGLSDDVPRFTKKETLSLARRESMFYAMTNDRVDLAANSPSAPVSEMPEVSK